VKVLTDLVLDTVVDGLLSGSSIAIAIAMAITVLVLGFGAWWTFALDRGTGLQAMNGGSMDNATGGDMAGMAAPDDVPRFTHRSPPTTTANKSS
jgi:hypothetical protein